MYDKRYEGRNYHRHSPQYDAYLNSPEWQQKRAVRLWIDQNECQMCGAIGNLEVHHLCSYQKLGQENVYVDLVSLCPACHKKIHKMMRRITAPSGRRGWKEIPDS